MEPISSLVSLRQQDLSVSLDADQLREQARQRIEVLASELWTDYNSHDPGITILEQLAYAITELGLRTRLPIEDLLASGSEPSFYTAREVLPNAALTPNDYRRLLLALDGIVRDAQVVTTTSDRVEGLYTLKVLFAEGLLNESWLEQEIELEESDSVVFQTRVYFVPPDWRSLPDAWLTEDSIDAVNLPESDLSRIVEEGRIPRYHAKVIVSINSQLLELDTWIYTQTPVPPEFEARFQSKLLEYLRSTQKLEAGTSGEAEEETEENKVIVGIFPRFRARTQQILGYRDTLHAFLNQHRNLCEDWVRIEPVRIQQIAVCMTELELTQDAEPLAVLAEIYFTLQQFIEPQLRPRSLDQLLAEGKVPEDIFQGEQLEPESGFLLEEDLQGLERGNSLYTSDLVRLMMQVPGVFALSGLSLRAFIDRFEVNRDVRNCMRLFDPDDFYPRLSLDDCEIKLYRQGMPVPPLNMQTVKDRVQQLHAEFKAGFPKEAIADLPVPQGTALDIESYYSIQNEFPQTYRLRQGEITPDMPPERKAQAKQLKGYLLLFEQLLANYCSQLVHVQDLFSIRKQIGQTYYHQPLYWVPVVQALLQAFLDEQRGTPLSWEAFTRNCNGYIKALNEAAEDQQAFRERRQQFIEHLLSRYGESFGDYPAWVRVNNGGLVSSDLLMDQLEFLLDFPALSARRATAHNYGTAEVWDTDNVSGLEKRVARLLGMPDCQRRSLSKLFDINDYRENHDIIDTGEGRDREGRFRIWNAPVEEVFAGGAITSLEDVDYTKYKILLSSALRYPINISLEEQDFVNFTCRGRYYSVTEADSTRELDLSYRISLLDERKNSIAAINGNPTNRGEVEQRISEVIHLMQGRYAEGMHLIEHTLLRPVEGSTQALAPVRFELKGESGNTYHHTFVNDPYSFQISIFLPGWAPRFNKDQEFRVIVERTIRQETPAHILPWIYWVDLQNEQVPGVFLEFEDSYQQWLESLNAANRAPNQDNFINVFNALVRRPYVTLTNLTAYRPFSIER